MSFRTYGGYDIIRISQTELSHCNSLAFKANLSHEVGHQINCRGLTAQVICQFLVNCKYKCPKIFRPFWDKLIIQFRYYAEYQADDFVVQSGYKDAYIDWLNQIKSAEVDLTRGPPISHRIARLLS